MKQEFSPDGVGDQVGSEAIDSAERRASQYCAREQERMALANEAKLMAVRAEGQLLTRKAEKLAERIRNAPPPGDARSRKRKVIFYGCVAGVLMVAGFYFVRLTFEPFRLGMVGWIVPVGVALVAPLLLHWFLKQWNSVQLLRILVTGACLAALTGMVLLAKIRGDLLKEQMQHANDSVTTITAEAAPVEERENNFYEQNTGCLQISLALLALAMEIAAGLAVFEARRYASDSGDDPDALERELAQVHAQLVAHAHEQKRLENEPQEWATAFQRDYHRAALNSAKRNGAKWLPAVLLCITLLNSIRALGADSLNLVTSIDLSASVTGAKCLDGKTEFDQDLAGVGSLLAAAPAGSKITVLGITDRSFATPYILLAANVGTDEGYFHERINKARRELVHAWQKRCTSLITRFQRTDLLGSLIVAAQLLHRKNSRNVLVIFSDMRQDTPDLNLDLAATADIAAAMAVVERAGLVADLKGVEVYALGVDAAGKSPAYWQSLRAFWHEYFGKAGASLRAYSMFRELPDFGR